ncbi:MAG TPA: hypothetical protein DEO65_09005 [Bacillus bacterium]|uniref:Sodium:proline symporter n=1 Tax=Siminovitchia fordii TaxID=254759 RepID=A0ABQ4K148_9BACI|nr:hypothetical protein [Siminovitchia fordii]GIN19454.1 sodium:proline symporter [Siminovitchia fordii]HBZ10000.1 hypothetical protein [Bacillus sp. (in: firmicutes)]
MNSHILLGIAVVLLLMFGVAVYSYMKSKDLLSFYIAERGGKWYLILGSLFASGISGASFLGMMSYYYDLGAGTLWINIGIAWSYFVLCFFIGPKLRRFGQLTIPDYLANRFDSPLLGPVFSIIASVWMVVLLGSLYVQGGLLLSELFGMSYASSTIIICAMVIIFTILGGMVVVLNTDFIAMFILTAALVITVPFLVKATEGWGPVTESLHAAQPDYFTNAGELTPFMAFSWLFIWLFGYLGNPGYLTRFYAASSVRDIVKAGMAIALIYLPVSFIFFGSSFFAKTIYPNIEDSETIWLTYTFDLVPPFIVGIAMAGLFVAILSSANTWLLAGATSLGRDIYQKLLNKDVSEKKLLVVTKLLVIFLGALSVPIGIWRPAYIMEMMNLAYLIAGSTGGLIIIMSMYYRSMTKEAAWGGIISGSIIAISWKLMQRYGVIPAEIDPMIPTLIVTCIVIIVISKLTKPSKKMIAVFEKMAS